MNKAAPLAITLLGSIVFGVSGQSRAEEVEVEIGDRSAILPLSAAPELLTKCSPGVDPIDSYWRPTQADIELLEELLPNSFDGVDREHIYSGRLQVNDFHRQYTGALVNDRKLIYIELIPSGFIDAIARNSNSYLRDWRSDPIVICNHFWGVAFDIEEQTFGTPQIREAKPYPIGSDAEARDLRTILPLAESPRLLEQCARPTLESADSYWMPSEDDINLLEENLQEEYEQNFRHLDSNYLFSFYRQYVGVVISEQRIIYANFAYRNSIYSALTQWKSVAVNTCGGDHRGWRVTFNVDTQTFEEPKYNGGF